MNEYNQTVIRALRTYRAEQAKLCRELIAMASKYAVKSDEWKVALWDALLSARESDAAHREIGEQDRLNPDDNISAVYQAELSSLIGENEGEIIEARKRVREHVKTSLQEMVDSITSSIGAKPHIVPLDPPNVIRPNFNAKEKGNDQAR